MALSANSSAISGKLRHRYSGALNGSWTLTFWLKTVNPAYGSFQSDIVRAEDGTGYDGGQCAVVSNAADAYLNWYTFPNGLSGPTTGWETNRFVHHALVLSGNALKTMYQHGAAVATHASGLGAAYPDGRWVIGNFNQRFMSLFDFAFFKAALTPDEIMALATGRARPGDFRYERQGDIWLPLDGWNGIINQFRGRGPHALEQSGTPLRANAEMPARVRVDPQPVRLPITGAPEIGVVGNSVAIADGDATPSGTDHTDFGTVTVGGATVSRTFVVQNTGTAVLTISGATVPTGFTITTALPGSIAAGSSANLVVRLDAAVAGTKSGEIVITCNDLDEGTTNFAIVGLVVPPGTGSNSRRRTLRGQVYPQVRG